MAANRGSFISRWIFLPIALVLVFMIAWGIIGKKLVVVPELTQGSKNITGVVSDIDFDNKTLKLDVNEEIEEGQPTSWTVDFSSAKKAFAIKKIGEEPGTELVIRADVAGLEGEYERYDFDVENLSQTLKDGDVITFIGSKKMSTAEFKASIMHLGGIFNAPELHERQEPAEIYKTAVILCIACVGLGESNLFWFWLIMALLLLVILGWVVTRIVIGKGGVA
ncbi:MAG TPA: hypothetical protein PKV16_08705 [Caldisericia bacterium]|nr:hypothetical protein [Caldisericia bacterium]HPF49607.1 hypothetical protein [Caldisericia bacterium]HPI84477.1 hypothetical protein [Caldisericia bacterium]HPQ93843.1 hypothetical protein [Caldisericia bacterium]HRV75388.1 hypothetical protein [Caldisericia bacterium]